MLTDAAPGVHNLNFLLDMQPGMRCFVLSTQQEAPAASTLSQLNVPFLLCQSAQTNPTPELLQGFYNRLLTRDLAVACTLACLENDPVEAKDEERSELIMLAQTPELHLGPIRVSRRRPRKSSVTRTRVRILVLKANPRHRDQTREGLRIDHEMKEIKFAMRENWRCFDWRDENVRIQDFSGYLLSHRPAILHFSGHALPSGELALEQYTTLSEARGGMHASTGLSAEPDLIPFSTIAGILGRHQDMLRCVVLNACYTEPLAEAICEYIDCAIGIRGTINDGLAVQFSNLFYQALSYGESVGQAFHKACDEISLRHQATQAEIFHLKCKPGVDPDSLFFVHTEEDNI
ncbi:hypothetical protein KDAU_54540 [Dictyobacter aurantiacus]|uniref:CHAT domain-containing protein n=1 Tax=Dictyobacter aurantiacus TaxID=1936993 RepID=A0A401ZMP0_9CHLR|nr:hypothetical protein KDAU_54540 [Dictyobacter aurantiacus]